MPTDTLLGPTAPDATSALLAIMAVHIEAPLWGQLSSLRHVSRRLGANIIDHVSSLPSCDLFRPVQMASACCSSPQYSMSILSSTTGPLEPHSETQ
jgi:hypothetical protein